ncbi:hypothetical protein BDV27DRAFT_127086 [Aspergillus caelatus]|uniref:Uncharacterized protein n=1 Tax=Aspergillus caelatus TaxID=61420 RepID=A0A5N7A795_9EURO|nr:uncharacterized protein BDV27DRAFT_127086 [Aspergillus caelatus]KAE8365308.1 hypothetical protein BDV27DRAFT_127086 [Aspergillus caelatus]
MGILLYININTKRTAGVERDKWRERRLSVISYSHFIFPLFLSFFRVMRLSIA